MSATDTMRTIEQVKPTGPARLRLNWSDGVKAELDLSAWLAKPPFAALRDPAEFAKVKIGDWGHSLVWASGVEAGADSLWLETLSITRRENTRAFLEWRMRHGLSLTGAAEALGLSRRMVAYYSNGEKEVPTTVLLACIGWQAASGTVREKGSVALEPTEDGGPVSRVLVGFSGDAPIQRPEDDLFGLDSFARTIAGSIERMIAPTGVVLAINGAWGSGKSSAVNLIEHHLGEAIARGKLIKVAFNPWWFPGGDALTLALFQELNAAIGPTLSSTLKDSLGTIGQSVSAAGSLLAAAANLAAPGAGTLVAGAAGLVGKASEFHETVEQRHAKVSAHLAKQSKRFLVVIDDIDRLSPDDAVTVFRLVKSVARLPNVIYLLAFDRDLAERIVADRFPSEGASYLEKIIQASFEVPPHSDDILRLQVLHSAFEIFGTPPDREMVRFMNVFYDVVSPELKNPRDVVRLVNDVVATWPAVAGLVDRADFLALSTLRLFLPTVYRAIRDNEQEVCGAPSERASRASGQGELYDRLFDLKSLDEIGRERRKRALMRLFPRLEGAWTNVWHTDDESWRRERRICASQHYPTYFAFSPSEDVLSAKEISEFLRRAEEREFVAETLLLGLSKQRRSGTSRAALWLEELTLRAQEVDERKVPPLTSTLFAIADTLDVEGDQSRGFAIASNELRLHWLMNRLVTERFDVETRAVIYAKAMQDAEVGWACNFASRCSRYFDDTEKTRAHDEPIVPERVAEEFRRLALAKLRAAAKDGTLLGNRHLASLLFTWSRFGSGSAEVKRWTNSELRNADFVVAMARAMTSVGWSQGVGMAGLGDRVARRTIRVYDDQFLDFLNVEKFKSIVRKLLSANELSLEGRSVLETYSTAPRDRFSDESR